jgi:RNA polymerase sigma-70 factor (ECF subfamily)
VGGYIPFADVVQQVANSEPAGFEKLYRIFATQVAALRRQFGYQDFEDRLHDVFLIVVDAIQSGKVREPNALLSYIQGTSRFVLCSHTNTKSRRRRLNGTFQHWESARFCRHTPEESLWLKERSAIMQELLRTLSRRERELLERFYINEQDKDQICREMGLTDTQFRLAKSRAKAHLARLGAQRLAQSHGLAA